MLKNAIIKKLNDKYRLYSKKKGEDGKRKNLGTFDSLKAAKERERQIQYFKHQADDGKGDTKEDKMLKDLSDIAGFLEEAGFVDKADRVYAVMNLIDHTLDDNALDPYYPTNAEKNPENQGYIGGEGPISNNYSGYSIQEGQPSEDGKFDINEIAHANGVLGNSVTDNEGTGNFNILSDSYFYTSVGNGMGQQ